MSRKTSAPEVLDVWLESQLGLVEVHYWQDEPDQMAAVLARVGPAFDSGSEPPAIGEATTSQALAQWQLAERRHQVDEEILENAKKALAAEEEFPHAAGFRGRPGEVDIALGCV